MKIPLGVMGSAETAASATIHETATKLGQAIAAHDLVLFTGATTGVVYVVGKSARDSGVFHIGISPGENEREHVEIFELPTDACDAIVYTGFGLKGRNVVLVRSCAIVIFIAGSIGSFNEFTIAYDEGKIIGCLTGTGGVADEIKRTVETFQKGTRARIVYDDDPARLIERCVAETKSVKLDERS